MNVFPCLVSMGSSPSLKEKFVKSNCKQTVEIVDKGLSYLTMVLVMSTYKGEQ